VAPRRRDAAERLRSRRWVRRRILRSGSLAKAFM
jgi:hypothetical protein